MTSSPRSRPRIGLFDPHPLAQERLRRVLESAGVRPVVSKTMNECRRWTSRPGASVLLVDHRTLGVPLGRFLASLRSRGTCPGVLLLGSRAAADALCRFLALGVHGYVTYESVEETLVPAFKAVSEGRFWFSQEVLEQFVRRSRPGPTSPRPPGFTRQETAVAGLLREGLSLPEMARALGLAERTVRFHVSSILAKLGLPNRQAAAERLRATPTASVGMEEGTRERDPTLNEVEP